MYIYITTSPKGTTNTCTHTLDWHKDLRVY